MSLFKSNYSIEKHSSRSDILETMQKWAADRTILENNASIKLKEVGNVWIVSPYYQNWDRTLRLMIKITPVVLDDKSCRLNVTFSLSTIEKFLICLMIIVSSIEVLMTFFCGHSLIYPEWKYSGYIYGAMSCLLLITSKLNYNQKVEEFLSFIRTI